MGRSTGWKVATALLSLTTVVLAAALVLRPEPEVRVETVYTAVARAPAAKSEGPRGAGRERRRVSPPPTLDDAVPAPSAPPEDPRVPSERERLAQRGVEDVCREELLAGGTAPADLVVERLLRDRERATELMLAWHAKRNDPRWRELGLQLASHFNSTFLAVAGDAAATPLRQDWLATRDQALMAALVRHGDAETLQTIDEDHRKPHPRRRENPHLLVDLGEPAREMVWGWILDPSVDEDVRTTAIGGMWVRGTDEDRRRLWTEMDDTIRVLHFAPHMVRDDNDWSRQLRGRVEAMLVDADPWVRLHAARAALQNRFEWGVRLARRASDIAAEDAQLSMPGGRDERTWKELLRWIAIHRSQLPAQERDDAKVREALGLE